jgi:hypothetical protein
VADDAVRCEPVSAPTLPGNREKNREIDDFDLGFFGSWTTMCGNFRGLLETPPKAITGSGTGRIRELG